MLLTHRKMRGYRFPIGKPMPTIKVIGEWIEKEYLPTKQKVVFANRRCVDDLSEQEIENSGELNCHGELVCIYALEGEQGEIWDRLKKPSGAAYDWIFVYCLEA